MSDDHLTPPPWADAMREELVRQFTLPPSQWAIRSPRLPRRTRLRLAISRQVNRAVYRLSVQDHHRLAMALIWIVHTPRAIPTWWRIRQLERRG